MTVPAVQEEAWDLKEIGHRLRDPALTYDLYSTLCGNIGALHQAVRYADTELRFAAGDAVLMGEQLFGERCYQAVEQLGMSEEVRAECVRIAAAIPRSLRRKHVHWSSFRAVAAVKVKLPSGEKVYDRDRQRELLRRVAEEGLSHHALRDELRNGETRAASTCRCCGRRL